MLIASFSRSFARQFLTVCLSLATATAALFAQSPSANDGFDPNVDGTVNVVAVQPDGRILVGGQFTSVRPNGTAADQARNNLARFNSDGSLDLSFNPNPDGAVRAIVLQPDGNILIGGDFTQLQPGAAGTALPHKRVARLTASGGVDATFAAGVDGPLLPQVYALALQANGSVIIGGNFATVQVGTSPAVARRNLARVSATGAIEAYDPSPSSIVLALALHSGGRVIAGGGFTTFLPNGATTAVARNRIARINVDGTIDAGFNPNANNGVTSLAVQTDGRIVVGGYFTTLQPTGTDTAASRSHVARLEADGSLDTTFEPNTAGNVMAVAVQPDGGILVGGTFSAVWSKGAIATARSYIARFNTDGTVDTTFNTGLNSEVDAIAVQADGKVILGGYFTRAYPVNANTDIVTRNRVVRVQPNGEIDTAFQLVDGGRPLASVVQADGKVIIGGSFSNVAGASHNGVARLNADGTVDASYNPSVAGRVLTLALQADGKLLIGGAFSAVNGVTRSNIARLNVDGSLDTAFNPNPDAQVAVITIQPDGKILVGGFFTSLQPTGATAVVFRSHVMRLTADGQVDTPFDPNADSTVSGIAVQSDGKIILGGSFTSLLPNSGFQVGASRVARVNADGTFDSTFTPNLDGQVSAIVIQSDGKIILGGAFRQVLPSRATAAVDRNRILRLNSDGTLDTAFNPNANGNVLALALQPDGKIVAGGTFTTFQPNSAPDWTLRKYAGRLNPDGTVDATFNLDINELSGNRVDSLRVLPDNRILIGGNFASFQPIGSARIARENFARLTSTGAVDLTFNVAAASAAAGTINALALQPDGKVIAGGQFSDIGGAKTINVARFLAEGIADPAFGTTLSTNGAVNALAVRSNSAVIASPVSGFAWLNANGTLRSGFAPGSNVRLSGQVFASAVQADGSVILAGSFANLTNATNGNLIRLNGTTGALDASFNPNVTGPVTSLAIQSDGKIIIAGTFTMVNGAVRNRIARLNADGTIDAGYDPNANDGINTVALQANGQAIIGGAFTALQPNNATTSTPRTYIARLNTDGTVDSGYNPTASANVFAVAIQPDGKAVVGGAFTSFAPNGATTTTTRNYVARLNTDATVDTGFDPNMNGQVNALALEPNGDILIGGVFTSLEPTVNGTKITGFPATNMVRIHSDGSIDRDFNPAPNGAVNTIARQSNGQIIIGGTFTTLQPNGAATAVTRTHLARINSNGTLDIAFNPDVTGAVYSVVARPDGSVMVTGNFSGVQGSGVVLVGGAFTTVGGVAVPYLGLLNDDGSVNSTFLPSPNGIVNAIQGLPDGSFVVGGAFTTIAGTARGGVARFNASGALDTDFNANAPATVTALAIQSDGKVIIGGTVTTSGTARVGLARLNPNGTVDSGFNSSIGGAVGAARISGIAVTRDGKIVVAGTSGTSGFIARLDADGSADATFTAPTVGAGSVDAIAVQTDGKVILAGTFTISGRSNTVRLNADGSIDTSFSPAPAGSVRALALQSDGRVVLGGNFTTVGGLPRVSLARLAATGPAANSLAVTADRTTVLWLRSGTAAELSGVTFEISTDNRTWTALGAGSRITDGWQRLGLSLPASGTFYLRARGVAPSSAGTSSGVFESVRAFNYASSGFGVPTSATDSAVASFRVDPFSGVAVGVSPGVSVSGISSTAKIVGTATEVGTNIVHPNGNTYDQVLLQGTMTTVTADPGQVVRLSYLGLNNEIVQVEFSGAGSLSLMLDGASGPVIATNYNQPDVAYMRGHARIIISDANESTNLSVFSVGRLTAVNQALFRDNVSYEGIAGLAYVAISSSNGKFGAVRTGDVNFYATQGLTGVYAPGVNFSGPVYVGDVNGFDNAVAALVVGSAADTSITGGDLFQPNGQPVIVGGISQLKFVDGTTADGRLLPAQINQGVLEENDADVTTRVVVNPNR